MIMVAIKANTYWALFAKPFTWIVSVDPYNTNHKEALSSSTFYRRENGASSLFLWGLTITPLLCHHKAWWSVQPIFKGQFKTFVAIFYYMLRSTSLLKNRYENEYRWTSWDLCEAHKVPSIEWLSGPSTRWHLSPNHFSSFLYQHLPLC